MPREFASGIQHAEVAALPAAAASPRVTLAQGGKLWFSDGAAWIDLGAAGGGSTNWIIATAGQTLADDAPVLAVITTSQTFGVPTTITAGQTFVLGNSPNSGAMAIAEFNPGASRQIAYGNGQVLPLGETVTLARGETISVVARTATVFDLQTPGAVGPAGPPGSGGAWGGITGTLSAQTDLQNALNAKLDDSQASTAGLTLLGAADAAAQRTALNVANGATANATDAALRDRLTHTGAFEEFPLQSAAVATPAAGFGRIYMRQRAGRVTLETLGPSGVDNALQPAFFNNRVMIISPNTTTTVSAIGLSATTAATLSHPALATTSLAASIYRTRCQTSTTAGNAAGIRHSVATMLRGNATALGGFYFHARVCSGNIALAGGEAFIGLSSSVTALAGAPSALADCVGLVKDVADTSWQFVRRTGTGTAQKVALTTPLTYAANQTIDIIIYSRPNGTGLGCVVRSFNNAGVPTTHLDTEYITDIPAVGTLLAGRFDIRNGATAAAADFDLVRMYAESDF